LVLPFHSEYVEYHSFSQERYRKACSPPLFPEEAVFHKTPMFIWLVPDDPSGKSAGEVEKKLEGMI
jgi:hypothetical protein